MFSSTTSQAFPVGAATYGTYVPQTVGPVLMTVEEIDLLIATVPPNGSYLELGTWCGAGAAAVASRRPDTRIVSVDNFDGFPYGPALWWANARPRMQLFVGTVADFAAISRPKAFDVILVDASHREADVLHDLACATQLVTDTGTLLVHDYTAQWPGVVQAVNKFCQQTPWRRIEQRGSLVKLRHDRQL